MEDAREVAPQDVMHVQVMANTQGTHPKQRASNQRQMKHSRLETLMVQSLVTLVQSRLIRKTPYTSVIGLWLTSRFVSTHVACRTLCFLTATHTFEVFQSC